MFKKISIRWRLTLLSAVLLTICCLGLTVVLNFSTFQVIDQIDATKITTPATEVHPNQNQDIDINGQQQVLPSLALENAKKVYSLHSLFYMVLIILGGSILTHYVAGKALHPLEMLNCQVKKINENNLSESITVPSTNDEVAQLTQSFNQMTDKLNDAFIAQRQFSASAAHELRTPLAVLQTKVDVFKKKNIHTNVEYDALINVFETQIARLRRLSCDLLDMTDTYDAIEKSEICLKDIFNNIFDDLSVVANENDISLRLNCTDNTVLGNVDLLYRAFFNLIENGIKYNIHGGYVEIDVKNDLDNRTEILVKDSGIGIPDDMKAHVFEAFYRVDKSRSRQIGGAGLGLSMVDTIIKKHGGTISALDNENGGTCFKVTL
ncbi:MAG: ATP-binding protein [Anaerovoracaceae bacterium]